jgi:hypothetical protein
LKKFRWWTRWTIWRRFIFSSITTGPNKKVKRNVVLFDWSPLWWMKLDSSSSVMMRSHSWRLLWCTRKRLVFSLAHTKMCTHGKTGGNNNSNKKIDGPSMIGLYTWRDPENVSYPLHITQAAHGGWFTFNRWPQSRVDFSTFYFFK